MSNIILLPNHKHNEEKPAKWSKFYSHDLQEILYTYTDENGFVGIRSLLGGGVDDLTSIKDLREDAEQQRDVFDKITPWGEKHYIACKEGVYKWDLVADDYVLIGYITKILRQKRVIILRNTIATLGKKSIQLKPEEIYNLDSEYITYIGSTIPKIMLIIHVSGELFEIPFDEKNQHIIDKDYAIISCVTS